MLLPALTAVGCRFAAGQDSCGSNRRGRPRLRGLLKTSPQVLLLRSFRTVTQITGRPVFGRWAKGDRPARNCLDHSLVEEVGDRADADRNTVGQEQHLGF